MSDTRLVKRDRAGKVVSSDTGTTVADLKGRTYAVFTGSGVRVDLKSFFSSDSGQRAVKKVAGSSLSQSSGKRRNK
jgi:hypothetical protein